jgi:3-oxoacyl-[acyl-carrier protein] reductase
MNLEGKIAVVTGAGRGIGSAIAKKFAAAGADVAILYRKKPEPAANTVAEIEKLNRKAKAYQCDVSDQELVSRTFSDIKAEFGRIDVLVNNAGLASWGNFIADTTPLEWDKIMKSNVYGPYNCIHEVLPIMREQKGGHIISISSSITLVNPPTGGPYAVAKAGLESLTKVVAAEETGKNIHVHAIGPDMKKMYANMPFGRVCQPDDIANMALFLCSEEAGYIQGQVIYINGGKTFL